MKDHFSKEKLFFKHDDELIALAASLLVSGEENKTQQKQVKHTNELSHWWTHRR